MFAVVFLVLKFCTAILSIHSTISEVRAITFHSSLFMIYSHQIFSVFFIVVVCIFWLFFLVVS